MHSIVSALDAAFWQSRQIIKQHLDQHVKQHFKQHFKKHLDQHFDQRFSSTNVILTKIKTLEYNLSLSIMAQFLFFISSRFDLQRTKRKKIITMKNEI